MAKYKGNINHKFNLFERNLAYKRKITSLKNDIAKMKKQIPNVNNLDSLKADLYDKKVALETVTNKYHKFKKKIVKIATVLGVGLILGNTAYGYSKEVRNFDTLNNAAYNITEIFDKDTNASTNINTDIADKNSILDNYSDLSYESFINDLLIYVQLNQKDELTTTENKELNDIKSRIKANSKGITHLSLDILKQKIAESVGIDDYSKISIEDKSTEITANQYNPETGSKTDISILLDKNYTIASLEKFQNYSNGDITITSNSIPPEILDIIHLIENAEKSGEFNDATGALQASLNLNSKDISLKNPTTKKEIESDGMEIS